jgi:large subunit ribosomal protein L5
MNPMEQVKINKATVNIGVGEGGEQLARAEKLLNNIRNLYVLILKLPTLSLE